MTAAGQKYRTIVADPPWPAMGDCDYRTRPLAAKGGLRGRDSFAPYGLQPLEWIRDLPIGDLVEDESHLYLWVTAGLNREGEGVKVARAWGFKVVSEVVWRKSRFGLGRFPRPQHEIILICRRGSLPFARTDVGSVQDWKASTLHSAKPEAFLDLVESNSPGPYLELFARRNRLGWDTWGNECLEHVEMVSPTA